MKKHVLMFCAAIALVFTFLVVPENAEAIPSFARQTGMSCNSCHFQKFPALNQFGRAFKTGGFTMSGGRDMIESEIMSLPVTLNASLVTKLKFEKTDGDKNVSLGMMDYEDLARGRLSIPAGASMYLAGRAGNNIGFIAEIQLLEGGGNLESFKVPFTYVVEGDSPLGGATFAVTPFTTEMAGAAYGLELLNTGAYMMQRPYETGMDYAAQLYIGTGMEATGVTLSVVQPLYFANYTAWAPDHTETTRSSYLSYGRIAVTPNVGGWDLAGGVQVWGGTTKDSIGTEESGKAFAVDAQAQGAVGTMPLGVYFSYASAEKSSATVENLFNASTNGDRTAYALFGELGVIDRLSLSLGFRVGDTGATANSEDIATTLGAAYLLRENIQIRLDHAIYSGDYYDLTVNNEQKKGESMTGLMVIAGF